MGGLTLGTKRMQGVRGFSHRLLQELLLLAEYDFLMTSAVESRIESIIGSA